MHSSDPLDRSDAPDDGDALDGCDQFDDDGDALDGCDQFDDDGDAASTVAVEELAARFPGWDATSRVPVGFGEVVETYETCERVCELATEAPPAARRLAPCVLAVVRELTDREGATVETMLLADVVERTLAAALDAVVAVSGPDLATAYEAAGRPLERVVETLAMVLRDARAGRHHDRVVRALGGVAMARPETVIEGLADANALDETVRALPDDRWATASTESTTPTRSLALAVLAHDSNAERAARVRRGLDPTDPQPAPSVRLTAAVTRELAATRTVARRERPAAGERLADRLNASDESLEGLAAAVQDSAGTDRDQFARAFGEAAAVVGHSDAAAVVDAGNDVAGSGEPSAELPLELAARVRASDGSDRERAARALGEALAASLSPTAGVESLADRVAHTTGVEYVRSAQALGAIATVAPARIDASVPQVLVDRVDRVERATGADRDHATQVLGEAIATGHGTTERSLTAVLGERVRGATSSTPRDRAARALCAVADPNLTRDGSRRGKPAPDEPPEGVDSALGALFARTDADVGSLSAVSDALGDVSESERDAVCRALGIAAVELAPHSETGPEPLVERVRTGAGETRRRAARVLGEALLAGTPPDSPTVRESLAARVRREEGAERDRTARSLAEAGIAADAPGDPAVSAGQSAPDPVALRERAAEASGSRRRRLTRALGEALARSEDPASVVDALETLASTSSGLDRARGVRALGELVLDATTTPSGARTPPRWLCEHARNRTGARRTWCVRAAGEAVLAARDDPPVDVVDALCGRVTTATDTNRIRAGRALGETLAALEAHPDPPVSPSLRDRVAAAADAERAAAAIVVADLPLRSDATTGSETAAALVERIRASDGLERTLTARALGDHAASTGSVETTTHSSRPLAAALVDLAEQGVDSRGPLAAEALGLASAATTGDDDAPSRLEPRLRDAVRSSGRSNGGLAARALGTAAAVTDTIDDALAIPTLADTVRSGAERERTVAAWGLGVAIAAPDPETLADDLVSRTAAPPNELAGADVAGIVADAAEAGVLPVRVLVQVLPTDSGSSERTGRRTRLRDEAGGLDATLLAALASARAPGDTAGADAVRADVHDALATPSDHPAATRVAAVDALASLPTVATAHDTE